MFIQANNFIIYLFNYLFMYLFTYVYVCMQLSGFFLIMYYYII